MVHLYDDELYLYNELSDEEWVEKLMSVPPIEALHRYFFKVKCAPFLQYIAKNIMNTDQVESIMGEFYEFLQKDDWYVLRKYRAANGASLSTFLARCTLNYFCKQKHKEEKMSGMYIYYDDITAQLETFAATSDEMTMDLPVLKAFDSLSERNKIILQLLVINEQSAIEAADTIWKLTRSKERDWHKLPLKRVQSTISMMKQRAIYELLEKLNEVKN